MRAVAFCFFLLCLPISVAYGADAKDDIPLVTRALSRVSTKITQQEAALAAQLEQLKAREEQTRKKLEETEAEKSKNIRSLARLAEFKKRMQTAYPSNETYRILAELEKEGDEAHKKLPDLEAKERQQRNEADAARNGVVQKELELTTVRGRDAEIETKLRRLDTEWRSKANLSEPVELIAAITSSGRALALTSTANITSQDSHGPTTGIRVRFQGVDERLNGTTPRFSGLTGCTEKNLAIGYYYFWTEREGKATSDPNFSKLLLDEVETIELLEDR